MAGIWRSHVYELWRYVPFSVALSEVPTRWSRCLRSRLGCATSSGPEHLPITHSALAQEPGLARWVTCSSATAVGEKERTPEAGAVWPDAMHGLLHLSFLALGEDCVSAGLCFGEDGNLQARQREEYGEPTVTVTVVKWL